MLRTSSPMRTRCCCTAGTGASMIDLLRVYFCAVAFAVARRHSAERNQDAAFLERNRACWASRGGNERASEAFGLPYATCTRTAPSEGWTARPFASRDRTWIESALAGSVEL